MRPQDRTQALDRGSRELFPFLERAVSGLAAARRAAIMCGLWRLSAAQSLDRRSDDVAIGGPTGNRTRVRGFAVLYVTTPPSGLDADGANASFCPRGQPRRATLHEISSAGRVQGSPGDQPDAVPTGVSGRRQKPPMSHFGRRGRHSLLGIIAEVVPWSSACALDVPPATSSVSHGRAGRLHRKIGPSHIRRAQLRLGAADAARYTSSRQLVYCMAKTVVRQDGL